MFRGALAATMEFVEPSETYDDQVDDMRPGRPDPRGQVSYPSGETFAETALSSITKTKPETREVGAITNLASSYSSPIFSPLQEWEGVVTAIDGEAFTALVYSLPSTDKSKAESIEFALSDMHPDNVTLVKEGAIFRWAIGYLTDDVTRDRISRVIFRRLPGFTKRQMDEAAKLATEIESFFHAGD